MMNYLYYPKLSYNTITTVTIIYYTIDHNFYVCKSQKKNNKSRFHRFN